MGAGYEWKRLASYVITRREERGITTRQALADMTGLSYRLLGDLERGTRRVSDGTLAIIEQALAWAPGSVDAILSGGEPEPSDDRPDPETTSSHSAIRILSKAYRIASDISQAGDENRVNEFGEVLGDISQILIANSGNKADMITLSARNQQAVRDRPIRSLSVPDGLGTVPINDPLPLRFPRSDPTVLRIALGRYLKALREEREAEKEWDFERVRDMLGCTAKDIERLEKGKIYLDDAALNRLLISYGVVDPNIRRQCTVVSEEGQRSGWWTRYNNILPDWFQKYLDLERYAESIRSFEIQFIPGLLQTPDYAYDLIGSSLSDDVDIRVDVRIRRQRILDSHEGPKLWAVIDESALRHAPVSDGVMFDQIQHLIEMSRKNNVVLQILPFNSPPEPISLSFSLLRFKRFTLPDIIYTEQLENALYIDQGREVERYRKLLDRLYVNAYSPERSYAFLEELRDELEHSRRWGSLRMRA
ncbi:helix-turn-helix domain-containing protein [Nocardia jejuensis]|uniref:helix-turn-helix domain-containing protein n=1 Tax=Nocardia jejuensis TaxID=328049 RepID=UPI001471D440|nr:helix-turn-helix transcriptional regulator [Nocardia jejuensis]